MTELERMLRKFVEHRGGEPEAGCWIGPTPQATPTDIPAAILAALVDALGHGAPDDASGYFPVTRTQAAAVLTMIATQSLAYSFPRPPNPDTQARAERCLAAALADDATFLCNGDWHAPQVPRSSGGDWIVTGSWSSHDVLDPEATFEAAVIGFDAQTAFAFWAREED